MPKRLSAEEQLQLYTVQLLRFEAALGVIWFHVPNAGKRSPRTGAHLKRLGMAPGAPDMVIIRPGGLVYLLELKRSKTPLHPAGRLSPEQLQFQTNCDRAHIPYAVVSTPEEVQAMLTYWGVLQK